MATQLNVIEEFRQDHRKVRDGLLELSEALNNRDLVKARQVLGSLNTMVGPHFRYEEEALYPTLREFLGEYVDQLVSEHDNVIDTAKECVRLLGKESLTDEERTGAIKAARSLLIHVSNCDGLAILSERLSTDRLKELATKLAAAREAGLSLLDWAENVRKQ